jgi:hypothetical protein
MTGGEQVLLTESGYINEEKALKWLDRFIGQTGAGPDKPWKILLMDNHASHCTPDFDLKCLTNHIEPFRFLSYFTHVLQPLDVAIFRPWKHWHKMAV